MYLPGFSLLNIRAPFDMSVDFSSYKYASKLSLSVLSPTPTLLSLLTEKR